MKAGSERRTDEQERGGRALLAGKSAESVFHGKPRNSRQFA